MAAHKLFPILFMAVLMGGCVQLSAERSLFSVADQGAPPLQGGIWIAISEDCPDYNIRRRRFPAECSPLDLRRQADGAWRVAFRIDLVSNFNARERAEAEANESNGPYRVTLAPAVERPIGDGYAPLYVGELAAIGGDDTSVSYAVIAPMGVMPADEMRIAFISCDSILRDGPIEGIEANYVTSLDPQARPAEVLQSCVASSQAAVREAARRAMIENLGELTNRRFVRVRAD